MVLCMINLGLKHRLKHLRWDTSGSFYIDPADENISIACGNVGNTAFEGLQLRFEVLDVVNFVEYP